MPGIINTKTEEGWPILGYATIANTDGKVVRDSLELFPPRRVPDGFAAVPLVSAQTLRSAAPASAPAPAPAPVEQAALESLAALAEGTMSAAEAAADAVMLELQELRQKMQIIHTTAQRQLKLGVNAVSASWLNEFINKKG